MELQLFLLLLVVYCRGQDSKPPNCEPDNRCPKFDSKNTPITDVEERSLNDNEWMCTSIKSPTPTDLMEARERLKSVRGYIDSWPVIISVINGETLELCWFVIPNSKPEINDEVRLEIRPKVPVYVRSSKDFPTLKSGLDEKRTLCDDLRNHGITCTDHQTYYVVVYDSIFSAQHYSEIWIEKNP